MAKARTETPAAQKKGKKPAKTAADKKLLPKAPVYTCPADGNKMIWVRYYGETGGGKMALRCEKCGHTTTRADL